MLAFSPKLAGMFKCLPTLKKKCFFNLGNIYSVLQILGENMNNSLFCIYRFNLLF